MTSQHAQFLATHTVADVLEQKKQDHDLIDIQVTATVEKVFETLLANDILSVPVYRKFNNRKDYVAIIDAFDLLSSLEEQGLSSASATGLNTEFLSMPVAILVGMTKGSSKLWTCQPSLSLTQLIELFTKHRVHRILVLEDIPVRTDQADSEENTAMELAQQARKPSAGRLVSQTDVIRYLLEHNHELGSILDISADGIAGHALTYAEEYLDEATASKLKRTPVSITIQNRLDFLMTGLDSDGSLVAEMSAADLRGINPNRIQDLHRPVLVYLKTCQGSLKRPLSCRVKFSLGQLMSGVVLNHAHRSWLVDDEDRPVGCITLSDILAVFLG
ncbi:hypothetical protein BGZ97_006182 [Linnemannia gamsii]|uniref:CBS domain-containing protein n=1 Tax=Linnemannia gamsii TaxID=64522 RepID=A0A9P6QR66_9FUNG|nr:hypothetical protein BGZ97_006182 [Linnemannia gamsii]